MTQCPQEKGPLEQNYSPLPWYAYKYQATYVISENIYVRYNNINI